MPPKTRRGEINERRRRKEDGVKESVKESKKERSTHTDTQKKRVRHFARTEPRGGAQKHISYVVSSCAVWLGTWDMEYLLSPATESSSRLHPARVGRKMGSGDSTFIGNNEMDQP